MISKHPFEPFIPKEATKLIIGTIPPQRFCIPDGKLEKEDVKFYYGSKDNYFWEIMGIVFKRTFTFENTLKSIEERKSFLTEISIGITDMVESCIHKDGSSTMNSGVIFKSDNIDSVGDTLNLGSNAININIGSLNNNDNKIINIGGSNDVVNISGTTNFIKTTNTQIQNKILTLNEGASGNNQSVNSGI